MTKGLLFIAGLLLLGMLCSGCAHNPYYAAEQSARHTVTPCDLDNCGKDPA